MKFRHDRAIYWYYIHCMKNRKEISGAQSDTQDSFRFRSKPELKQRGSTFVASHKYIPPYIESIVIGIIIYYIIYYII